MAVIFADGFPYDYTCLPYRWSMSQGSPTYQYIATSGGPYNDRYVRLASPGWSYFVLRKTFPQVQTVCLQFHYRTNGIYEGLYYSQNQLAVISYADQNSPHFCLHDNQGYLALRNGALTTFFATSTTPLSPNVWHYIEYKVKVDSSAGTVDVKQDGTSIFSYQNINTRHGSFPSTAGAIHFGNFENTHGQFAWVIDLANIIAMDTSGSYCNDLLGIRRVQPCMPTANGNYAQWTPSTGANWECVDEIPPNDGDGNGDRNATIAAGNKDTFVVSDVAAGAGIDAVVIDLFTKTADPAVITMKGLARSNSQDGEGSVITVPSSYSYLQSAIYRDPNGNIAWTGASFNAAEFGYKKET